MKKRKLPIFLELTRGSLLIIISILAIYTIIQLVTFWSFSSEYENEYLIDKYNEIVSLSKNINIEISETGFNEYLKALIEGENDEHVRIYSENKLYYEDKNEVWNKIEYTKETNIVEVEVKVRFINFDTYRILSGPLNINGNKYNLQIIQESDLFDDFIESYFPILVFILVLGIILSVVGAMYVSRNFIKRLKGLTATMNEIKEEGVNKRAEISELNDEIDEVKVVFNSMMDELEEAFDEQSRFVSDASHELKTPLTALHGHLSMLKRWGKNDKERLEKSLDICLNEVERLKKIVNDMLLLSKAEKTEINLSELEEINPKIIVQEVIEQYKVLNSNVKYTINIEENMKIKIDPNDLKQLLIIFIDNSIKYNDKENIEIHISLRKTKDNFKLEVKDNGMGIPKDEIRKVMKRFYKVDKSRINNNSFGIGLSIANRIANNYNAKIHIESEEYKYYIQEDKMKKVVLATIIISVSMSLVGCKNSKTLNNGNETNKKVTIEQAKEIALKHANLTSDKVSFIRTETDIDNGVEKYDIEFYYENKEYDYEINAANGEIIEYDYDVENYNIPTKEDSNNIVNNQQSNNIDGNQQLNPYETSITVEEAKEIALKHANLTSSQVSFVKSEFDFDDGVKKYDIEFYYNNREYNYEIDANTGRILSYEQD